MAMLPSALRYSIRNTRALAVFDERDDVVAAVEEARKFQLEVAVADDLVEHRFFRRDVGLVLDQVGPRPAELDGVANFRRAAILHRESVDPLS